MYVRMYVCMYVFMCMNISITYIHIYSVLCVYVSLHMVHVLTNSNPVSDRAQTNLTSNLEASIVTVPLK